MFERVWAPQGGLFLCQVERQTNKESFLGMCKHKHLSPPGGLVYYHMEYPVSCCSEGQCLTSGYFLATPVPEFKFWDKNRNLFRIIDCPRLQGH